MSRKDPGEIPTAQAQRLPKFDLRPVPNDPGTVLVSLETYNSDERVVVGPNVYVGGRPLTPLSLRVSKQSLREYFLDLIRKLDSLP